MEGYRFVGKDAYEYVYHGEILVEGKKISSLSNNSHDTILFIPRQ